MLVSSSGQLLPARVPAFALCVQKADRRMAEWWTFAQAVVRIGRSMESDLALVNCHKTVSRRHAEVRQVGQRFVLVDLESKNATYLNGLRLTPLQPYPLQSGDRIELGGFTVTFTVL